MTFRTVVFDFDGTLADTLPTLIAAFRRVAPRFGLSPALDLATARTRPTRQLIRELGLNVWTLPQFLRAFQAEAATDAGRWPLFPGVPDMLAGLTAAGCRLGILSSNREDAIRACLRANGVEDRFAFVVGYPRLFGKATALRWILRRQRIPRAELLYVGDELRDLEAATRAKVAMAAVTWGFNSEEVLAAAGPAFVVRTPVEVVAVLAGGGR